MEGDPSPQPMRPSPCTTAVTHDVGMCRSTPSDAQLQAIERGEVVLLCRHCVHPPPPGAQLRGIPHAGPYHARDGETGQFCSLSCMVAYTLEHPTYRSGIQRAEILRVAHEELGVDEVLPAPPQELLLVFGGHLGIEEFRAHTAAGRVLRRCAAPFASALAIASVTEVYSTRAEEPLVVAAAPIVAAPPATDDAGGRVLRQLDEWGLANLRQPPTQPEDLLEPPAATAASFYQQFIEETEGGGPAATTASVATANVSAAAATATPAARPAEPKRRPARARAAPAPTATGMSRFLKHA